MIPRRSRVSIAVHDLVPQRLPETMSGWNRRYSRATYARMLAAADLVVTSSETVAAQLDAREAPVTAAFVREAWVGARVNSPWVGRIIELPPSRQTCLYTVMPLYQGELLETRLRRRPSLGLEEGRNIAVKLARGAAALHRAGIIHRDIKQIGRAHV